METEDTCKKAYLIFFDEGGIGSIEGVYSSQEKAEKACLLFNMDSRSIKEYPVDSEIAAPEGMLPYVVYMDIVGGSRSVYRGSASASTPTWSPFGDGKRLIIPVWASCEKHAYHVAKGVRESLYDSGDYTLDMRVYKEKYDKNPTKTWKNCYE